MMRLETNQSTLLARLTELDAKPLSVGTAEPSESAAANDDALTERTIHKPGSIEPCANAADANVTNYEASKVAKTGTVQPEVIREITIRQNMKKQTKAPIKVPNNQADQVQCVQPIWTRKLDEIELCV